MTLMSENVITGTKLINCRPHKTAPYVLIALRCRLHYIIGQIHCQINVVPSRLRVRHTTVGPILAALATGSLALLANIDT